jgi:hypothetical protein
VGIDDVERLSPPKAQATPQTGWKIGEHRRQVCNRQLASKEHWDAHDAYAVL